jgi:Fe-S-cluster containining protein
MPEAGRNDPCPCGSGKKYKKCCGAAVRPDFFEINRDIAYRGRVGLQRKEFCINYIEEKKERLVSVRQTQIDKVKELGKVITCQKGCHFCCSFHVQATIQECEAIVYYLYQNNDILRDFLLRYPEWREEVRRKGDLFKYSNRLRKIDTPSAQVIMERLDDENRNYDRQGVLCPFLRDGLCSIYEVRPYMCAALIAVSPPEYCKSEYDKSELYRAYPT